MRLGEFQNESQSRMSGRPRMMPLAPSPLWAGLSHVTQHIEEEGFVPCCSLEFATHGSLGVGVGAGDVEGETPENSQVGWRVVLAISRQILVEHDVERPVQAVFDAPMFANDAQRLV